MSLQKLADLVFYSQGYLSKVETGNKPPTAELAHRCDQVLEAKGTLIALADAQGWRRVAQLPAASAAFVGREAQLDHLERSLAGERQAGTPWTVAVDGPPGVGKTTLALRLAHQIKGQFPDGQLYVDLHGYSPVEDPAQPLNVLAEFLAALGVHGDTIPSGVDQRAALYRSLLDGRRVLLVLDNARNPAQVELLLPGSAGCGVLITSRTRLSGLDIRQDQRLTIGPMTEHESFMLLRTVIGSERADADPAAIRSLARCCGHLPLALRIAAERVATHPHHSINELVDELGAESRPLDALSNGDSTAVRSVFSWSYRDLSGEAAQMFRLLGLHPGRHVSVHAAAALAGVSTQEARRLLTRLVSVHLLEGCAGMRYTMHGLLRVYAAELAVAEEPEANRSLAMRRVLDWYLHTAYAANAALVQQSINPPLDPPESAVPIVEFTGYDDALAWCETELPNLVAATRAAVAAGQYATAWKIPVGCWNYLHLRKHWSYWVDMHEIGLTGARHGGDQFGEAWTLNNLAHAYRKLDQIDDAATHLQQALEIRRDIEDRFGEAWTLTNLALVDRGLGRLDNATERLHEALTVFRKIGNGDNNNSVMAAESQRGEGIVLAYVGDVYREQRQLEDALACLQQALVILADRNDRHGEAYTLVKLGLTYFDLQRHHDAIDSFSQALAICRAIGDRWDEAETLHSLGQVFLRSGHGEAARDSWSEAVALFDELGDPRANDVRADLAAITTTTAREPSGLERKTAR